VTCVDSRGERDTASETTRRVTLYELADLVGSVRRFLVRVSHDRLIMLLTALLAASDALNWADDGTQAVSQ
jgi:hypothetical protein